VQELVNRLVDEFVAKAERRPPLLAEVVQRLRAHHPELPRRGVARPLRVRLGRPRRGHAGQRYRSRRSSSRPPRASAWSLSGR